MIHNIIIFKHNKKPGLTISRLCMKTEFIIIIIIIIMMIKKRSDIIITPNDNFNSYKNQLSSICIYIKSPLARRTSNV